MQSIMKYKYVFVYLWFSFEYFRTKVSNCLLLENRAYKQIADNENNPFNDFLPITLKGL